MLANTKFITDYRFYYYRPLFESTLSSREGQQFGKGAIFLEAKIRKDKRNYHIHVINTHLPFLEKEKDQGKFIRDATISQTIEAFDQKVGSESSFANKFIIGDLNYRIDFGKNKELENQYLQRISEQSLTIKDLNIIKSYDQLTKFIRTETYLAGYHEGINNGGPNFLPTCKLSKTCPVSERTYQTIKKGSKRVPSWCDRILYNGHIECLLYENFDNGTTCKSDHIPVIGLFAVAPTI